MSDQILALLQDVRDDKPSVTSLRLVYKKIGPIEAKYIGEALEANSYVTSLRLDSNMLGDRGAQILAKSLLVSSLSLLRRTEWNLIQGNSIPHTFTAQLSSLEFYPNLEASRNEETSMT
jgi:hypothetical protein